MSRLSDYEGGRRWKLRGVIMFSALAMAMFVGGFGAWAAFANLSGAVIASGQIEVERNRQVVQHPDGGVVETIYAREGDVVEQGDILIQLETRKYLRDLSIVESQLFELQAKRGRLEAERDDSDEISFDPDLLEIANERQGVASVVDGQSKLFAARRDTQAQQNDQLSKRIEQSQSTIEGIDAQQEALRTQLDLVENELDSQQQLLEKNLVRSSTMSQLQRQQASLAGQLGELQAERARVEGQITEIGVQLLSMESSRREEAIAELRQDYPTETGLIEQRANLLERIEESSITAPVAGVVYNSSVFAERAVITPAEPIMYIVPQDRPLRVTARLSTISIDQTYIDQGVTLRFPAFNSRTTPEMTGHITRISADSFTDDRTGASYYILEAEIDENQPFESDQALVLVPGMPVEVFIRTDDRSPISYLVKPMSDFFSRALRE
ncbi:HlyD family type I secretion periplasmic adaptor subunit [Paracoccus sp. SCSIO 75233]|uniref:HlyD family type I secretion periplasmic adaptor subunit n=1 Tax=Paracoccus sp. SCSIO 75233 TaxID=3017782 RepID=UPI0022F0A689|nr:HlyD family type I secretion periplasmic adaptor subunit [Paracoccus sp. SCSIO 75233]WBU55369.1 HlyD family type I secretion periplasmic adaptor subunit [Paracoccus sp. SCSIO 75233]